VLDGGGGNDVLNGGAAGDILIGGAGNDTYFIDNVGDVIIENANEGVDVVNSDITHVLAANVENLTLIGTAAIHGTGTDSANIINGNSGNNTLVGLGGADVINGGDGNDVLYGLNAYYALYYSDGAADTLIGGEGNDIFYIDEHDTVMGGNGIDRVDASEAQAGITFVLKDHEIESAWGSNHEDVLDGGGSTVGVKLYGGGGWDELRGSTHGDVLNGGQDDEMDYLYGGRGNDTYAFGSSYGWDYIFDSDPTSGNVDVLKLQSGITEDQLWFSRAGNDLFVSIIGTTDVVQIFNWYLNNDPRYHIEQFKTIGGKTLLDSNVENLVSAMAAFSPPASGQTTLPQNYQNSLNSVIAANWS
jgi:Ca2+-binding RTX toxin-like protein